MGEENRNSSGFGGMDRRNGSALIYLRNLTHFDTKGERRKDGEAFSVSLSCTDWEISFMRWVNGKTCQLEGSTHLLQASGKYVGVADFQAIPRQIEVYARRSTLVHTQKINEI